MIEEDRSRAGGSLVEDKDRFVSHVCRAFR